MTEPIIEIDNLHISFFTKIGEIPAVMDFSMKVMSEIWLTGHQAPHPPPLNDSQQ